MTLSPSLQPIDWRTIQYAISDWVTDKSGWEMLWERQNVPQLAYPYLSLARSGPRESGGKPEIRTTTDLNQPLGQEIELASTSQTEFTLTVRGMTDEANGANDPDSNAMKIVSKLQASLGQMSVQADLRAAGLAVIETLGVKDLSEVVNSRYLSEAVFDVRLRAVSVMTEDTGYIDDVEVTYVP